MPPTGSECNGPTLRYIAELDGEAVAILLFASAALHIKARDTWIAQIRS